MHKFLRRTVALPILRVIIAVFVVAGAIYSVSTPLFDVSDEVRHFAMVEHYALGRDFPVQDPQHREFYEQEGSQPPLYYLLVAGVSHAFDISDFRGLAQFNPHAKLGRADATDNRNQMLTSGSDSLPWRATALYVHLVRLLGVLMGAVTVWATYHIALELSHHKTSAAFAAALTAFNPMFVFISASVNNDTLVTMCSSLAILLALRSLRIGLNWTRAILIGALIGCAALSKSSALALLVVIPSALWLRELLNGARIRFTLSPKIVTLALLAALICGWWYVRNWSLYGDPTGTQMMAQIAGPRLITPTWSDLIGEWDGFYKAYWGLFGAVNIPMALWIYRALEIMLALAGIGWIVKLRVQSAKLKILNLQSWNSELGTWMCLALFTISFAALIHWTSITLASQGRLLFPNIAIISSFIAIGLNQIIAAFKKLVRPTLLFISIALAAITLVAPFAYIMPAYALPPRITDESQLPRDLTRTELRFADQIRWIGYRIDDGNDRVRAGETVGVTLYWQALRPIDTNYSLFAKLFTRGNEEVAHLDSTPGGGVYPTSRWRASEIIADHYQLRLNETITHTPSSLMLDVGFWDFATKTDLQTFDGANKPTGRQTYEISSIGSTREAPIKADGHFTLRDAPDHDPAAYVQFVSTARTGDQLILRTRWQVLRNFKEDQTIFAHLIDAQGNVIAQADGRALGGGFSAKWWRDGDSFEDERVFDVPALQMSEAYTVRFGLYRASDFARLPAYAPDGTRAKDDALIFSIVQ